MSNQLKSSMFSLPPHSHDGFLFWHHNLSPLNTQYTLDVTLPFLRTRVLKNWVPVYSRIIASLLSYDCFSEVSVGNKTFFLPNARNKKTNFNVYMSIYRINFPYFFIHLTSIRAFTGLMTAVNCDFLHFNGQSIPLKSIFMIFIKSVNVR